MAMAMEAIVLRVLLLSALLLAGSAAASEGSGFSVELIHRDSTRSPFRDPALSPDARMLAAARRSLASRGGAAIRFAAAGGGEVVSEIVSRSFEYLMSVNVGTPPRQLLAIADTGSDLVWVNCHGNGGAGTVGVDGRDGSSLPRAELDPSHSSTYGVVGCQSDACRSLPRASCDAASHCQYQYSYGDGSRTVGVLSTETFTFSVGGGGGATQPMRVPKVSFGCSSFSAGTFRTDGIVGLGGGELSLVAQLGAATSFGRKFSYCLVPYYDTNASSAINFGSKAVVSNPGAVSTPLVTSNVAAYYTVELESVGVAGRTVANKTSRVIVDSGTTLTFLDLGLLQPLISELERRITLPRTQSPEQMLDLCYDVHGRQDAAGDWGIPDVTLRFGGGAAVTLKTVNTFVLVQEETLCLAVVPVSEEQPVSILGNVAQQDFHVGYDLDTGTVTFAAADCASSVAS